MKYSVTVGEVRQVGGMLTCLFNTTIVQGVMSTGFGEHLRGLRKQAGLSQRELAAQAGIDFTYLSKIENGRVDPPGEETMRAIAHALGVDAEDLLARARKMPRDLKRLVAQGTPEKALLLRRIAQTPLTPERVERMLRMLEEDGRNA